MKLSHFSHFCFFGNSIFRKRLLCVVFVILFFPAFSASIIFADTGFANAFSDTPIPTTGKKKPSKKPSVVASQVPEMAPASMEIAPGIGVEVTFPAPGEKIDTPASDPLSSLDLPDFPSIELPSDKTSPEDALLEATPSAQIGAGVPPAPPAAPKTEYPKRVTVLANYASGTVAFWYILPNTPPEAKRLRAGESIAVPYAEGAEVAFQQGKNTQRKPLQEDKIQVFSDLNKMLDIFILGPDYTHTPNPAKTPKNGTAALPPHILVIPVKVMCDDKVPLVRDVWEKRVRARIQAASDILEKTCFVRLHVMDVGSWKSDNDAEDLRQLLRDFESKVSVAPATLAMGFTAHKNWGKNGMTELGVTGHPFYPYILIREAAPQTTEVERLETLLHEMGHYLGAAHSSDENSIMRTTMKDRRGRLSDFVISYDPLNTLAMNFWVRQYHLAKGPFTPEKIETDIRQKLIATYGLFRKAAEFQAENSKKPLEVNPNVEFLLARLGVNDVKLDQNVVVKDAEKDAKIEKVAETAYDPEDPLGLRQRELQSANPVIRSETEILDNLLSAGEDPDDLLGIQKIQEQNIVKTVSPPAAEGIQNTKPEAEPENKKPKTTEKKKTPSLLIELPEGDWEPETISSVFQLPSRTAQYIIGYTLNAVLLKKELPPQKPGSFPGDEFTENIIRYAAEATLKVGGDKPADTEEGKIARIAFLLSLTIMLEPEETLQQIPAYGKRFRTLDPPEIQRARKALLNNRHSAFGRLDTCQHFSVSATLAAHISPRMAEEFGLMKEFDDDRPGGSGFDVTDLIADLAGVAFSVAVQEGRISLERIAKEFCFKDVIPLELDVPKEIKHPKNNKQAEKTMNFIRAAIYAMPFYAAKK